MGLFLFTYRVFLFLILLLVRLSFSFFFLLVGLRGEAHIRTQPQNIVLKTQTNFATQDTSHLLLIFFYIIIFDILTNFVGGATTASRVKDRRRTSLFEAASTLSRRTSQPRNRATRNKHQKLPTDAGWFARQRKS